MTDVKHHDGNMTCRLNQQPLLMVYIHRVSKESSIQPKPYKQNSLSFDRLFQRERMV